MAGIGIEKATERKRKWLLACSISANIGILVVFKYYNFLTENVMLVISIHRNGLYDSLSSLLLPIGLSFHTFQAMSYYH
jgi:D-alanyl-lipoteichoic acid acyltransferase DltB (MBOAT superfamily)